MSEIVRTVARLLRGLILVYGIHLMLYGHLTSGGGFAGGVVITCAFVLAFLAGGMREELVLSGRRTASILDCVGALLFLGLAAMGAWWAGEAFFANFIGTRAESRYSLLSGGIIPLANISIGLMVASLLFLAFTALATLRTAGAKDEEEDET